MEILEMTPLRILSWCQTRMAHFLKSCRVFDGMLAAVYDVIYTKGIRVDEQNLLFSVMNAYVLKIYSLSLKKRSSVKLAKLTCLCRECLICQTRLRHQWNLWQHHRQMLFKIRYIWTRMEIYWGPRNVLVLYIPSCWIIHTNQVTM